MRNGDRRMSQDNQTRIFLVLFFVFNLVISVALLTFTVIATEQRKKATSERREIICILKILPEDRQKNPSRVDACGR